MTTSHHDNLETIFITLLGITIVLGVSLGALGDYRGRQLNRTQLQVLEEIRDMAEVYKRIPLHQEVSVKLIQRAVELEVVIARNHEEFLRGNRELNEKMERIIREIEIIKKDKLLNLNPDRKNNAPIGAP